VGGVQGLPTCVLFIPLPCLRIGGLVIQSSVR
jgi:hypothetical protein